MLESVEQFRYAHYDTTPEEVYSAMWLAAPKPEPLSDEGMGSVLEEYYKTKGASFKTLIRLVEKAHGIGV
jgi:hypothetical protein